MSDNWFVQHPSVIDFILTHETANTEQKVARCVECGATVPVETVYNCYEQDIKPECGHSWHSYQSNNAYVLG